MSQISVEADLEEVAFCVWWDAPHEGALRRYMTREAVVEVGRGPGCEIRIGALPVPDTRVPRRWARLSWKEGRVHVENVDDRWGLDIVRTTDEESVDHVRPQFLAAPPYSEFVIRATVPKSDERHPPTVFEVHVASTANPVRPVPPGDDDAEAVRTDLVVTLTSTERAVGSALISPLRSGKGRRASLEEITKNANYARRTVRTAIYNMDQKFTMAGLSYREAAHRDAARGDGTHRDGDAIDRVAFVLSRHNLL